MIPGIGGRPVAAAEWLARFILRKEHSRTDGSVKPEPFMPYNARSAGVSEIHAHQTPGETSEFAQETIDGPGHFRRRAAL